MRQGMLPGDIHFLHTSQGFPRTWYNENCHLSQPNLPPSCTAGTVQRDKKSFHPPVWGGSWNYILVINDWVYETRNAFFPFPQQRGHSQLWKSISVPTHVKNQAMKASNCRKSRGKSSTNRILWIAYIFYTHRHNKSMTTLLLPFFYGNVCLVPV